MSLPPAREDHRAWYDDHIVPNLPPGIGSVPFEYFDLLLAAPES